MSAPVLTPVLRAAIVALCDYMTTNYAAGAAPRSLARGILETVAPGHPWRPPAGETRDQTSRRKNEACAALLGRGEPEPE